MNEHEKALDDLFVYATQDSHGDQSVGEHTFIQLVIARDLIKKLIDKTIPMKPIKLEIIDLDKIIMPEYTNTIDKYMCDNCGLTWFIVDEHTYQYKYCKQCGQAIDWGKDGTREN